MWYEEGAPPGWQSDPVFLAILMFLLWLGAFLGKGIERKDYPSTSKSWLLSVGLIGAFAIYLSMTWSRALEGVLLCCLLGISVWYGTRQIAPRPFLSLVTLLSIFGLFFWKTGEPLPFAPPSFEDRLARVQPFDLKTARKIEPKTRTIDIRNKIVSLGAPIMDWRLIDAAIHEEKLYVTLAAPSFRDSTTQLVAQFLRPETQGQKEPKSIYEENLPNKRPVGLARYSEEDLKFLRVTFHPDKGSLQVTRFGFEGKSEKSLMLENQKEATRESLRHSSGYGFITTDQNQKPLTMNYFYGPDFKDMNSVSLRRDGMYYLTPNKAFVLGVNQSTKSAEIAFARDESGPDVWIEIATIEPDASASSKSTTNLLLKLPNEASLSGLEISSVKATSEGYMIVAARRENAYDRAMGIDTGPDAVYVASVRSNGQLIWHAVYEDYVLNFGDSEEKVLAAADASGYAWLLPLTKNTKKSVDPSGYCVFTTYEPCTKFNTFNDPDFHAQSIVENKDEVALVGIKYKKMEDSSSGLESMFKSSIWLQKRGKTPSFVNFKKNARELKP